jgi:hypothetical protein
MKLRKGVVPLVLFVVAFAAWAIYTAATNDPVPMENGQSILDRP